MSTRQPRWDNYDGCPTCDAYPANPCHSLRTDKPMRSRAHKGRPLSLTARMKNPQRLSRFSIIVRTIMRRDRATANLISEHVHLEPRSVRGALIDKERPMTFETAERYLRALGYRMKVTVVPLSSTEPDDNTCNH